MLNFILPVENNLDLIKQNSNNVAMVIEDLILAIYKKMEARVDPWMMPPPQFGSRSELPDPPSIPEISDRYDLRFLWEIGYKINSGKPVSSKQGDLLVKLLSKYIGFLVNQGFIEEEINRLLQNPVYKVAPYPSHEIPREVRYIGNGFLAFRCMYNPKIVSEIKALQGKEEKKDHFQARITFNGEYKLWVVEVTENNLSKVMKIIRGFNFLFDETVLDFFYMCENISDFNSSAAFCEDHIELDVINDPFLSNWAKFIIPESEKN